MKLVLCKKCQDVVRLVSEPRTCKCGACGGHYIDDLCAVLWGEHAVRLGFDNFDLCNAIRDCPLVSSWGLTFKAFVIPESCETFKRVPKPKRKKE